MRRLDLISSAVIIILAGFALLWLIPTHVPSRHDPGDLPPSLVPFLSAVVLGVTGLLLGISAWRKRKIPADGTKMNEAAETMGFGRKELGNLLLLSAAAGGYWLLMKLAGFEAASGALIAAGMWYGGMRKLWVVGVSAVAMPVLVSQVCWHALNIQLP